jgi:UDP-N-acetylmuramyl tripeptide synthase
VLIAGKGHEEVQIIGDEELPFSDLEEVEQALEEHVGAGKSG